MNLELLLEAERRGILPPDKAALLTEARSRGLVEGGPAPTGSQNTNPGVQSDAPPEMFLNPNTGQYTSREMLSNAMQAHGAAPTTAMGATILGAGRGATLGAQDEIAGYLNAIVPGKGTMAERQTYAREMARAAEDAATATNPDDMLTSEIAGAVALPIGAVGQGGKLLTRMAGSALTGAGMGAAYGGLTGEGMENRAEQAQSGGILGATVGGLAPLVGAGVQKVGDKRAETAAIRAATRNAPTSEQLRARGQALYQQVDDAGVAIRPDRVRSAMDDIVNQLRAEGAGYTGAEKVMPASRGVMEAAGDVAGTSNTVPFRELDVFRRYMGNAAGRDLANKGDVRAVTGAMESLDDFVNRLGPNDVDAGDIKALQTALPKARETWAKMSRSQMLDDAIENAADYRTGEASGLRAQFQRIIRNPKLSRGFSEAEIKVMRRVVNGTLPEQILNYMGSGLGMMGQMAVGGLLGSLPGAMAGIATGAASRKASEAVVRKNAEIARALVANGGLKNLPVASDAAKRITETLMRRAGAVGPQ